MSIPIGSIVAVGFSDVDNNEATAGWLMCDGNPVSRTTYAGLFDAIGTAWGEGDGQTTFNLPDLRGQFVRGVDDGTRRDPGAAARVASGPGGNQGDAVGSLEGFATALPASGKLATSTDGAHRHDVPHLPTSSSWYAIAGSHYGEWNPGSVESSTAGRHNHVSQSGGDRESRPVNVYADFMIYAGN